LIGPVRRLTSLWRARLFDGCRTVANVAFRPLADARYSTADVSTAAVAVCGRRRSYSRSLFPSCRWVGRLALARMAALRSTAAVELSQNGSRLASDCFAAVRTRGPDPLPSVDRTSLECHRSASTAAPTFERASASFLYESTLAIVGKPRAMSET